MSRNVLVAIVAMVVFVVVAGAVYLELAASAGAKDVVWETVKPVAAGDLLTADNVRQARIPHAGDDLDYYKDNILPTTRAAHEMSTGTILFSNDVLQQDLALINLTLKTPPALGHGATIDVYAQVNGSTTMVGRRLLVDQVSGTNISVLVPAEDEPSWITLQASSVALYAARSTGVGVPQTRQQSMTDAIATLSGGSTSGGAPVTLPPTPAATPPP